MHECVSIRAIARAGQLQSVHRFVHIMHESTDTTKPPRGDMDANTVAINFVGPLATLGGYDQLSHEVAVTIGGKSWGLFGGTGFFLTGVAYTAPVFAYFLFQMVFMDTAATIPTGALAERWKFSAFAVFSVFVGAVIYPIYANWTWGGGWLAMLGKNLGLGHGHVDFAGSSVVHMTGGVMAFVTAALLGPRRGKYNANGTA